MACKIFKVKPYRNLLKAKNELSNNEVYKNAEIIEVVKDILNELDKEIMVNCADQIAGRILKRIEVKEDKAG